MFYRELMDRVDDQARELIALRARVAELEAGQDEAKGFIEGLDVENNALRARVAELESMNKMLCGKLDDQRRALWDPCQPYLKDGETPAECIARNRRDVDIALSSLARDRARVAELEVIAISICAGNCLPPFPCAQDGCPKRASASAGTVPE